MYEQRILEDILFYMLYAGVTVLCIIACVYLLFRRGNAFASDVTPPQRLRRWTIAFMASMALGHVWYLPSYFLPPGEVRTLSLLTGGLLDALTVVPFAIAVLFTMLQDRRRPLWPIAVMTAPLDVALLLCIITCSEDYMPFVYVYFYIMSAGLLIYLTYGLWRYSRWLRDNYADLEHKEIWQSCLVLGFIMITFGIYVGGLDWKAYETVIQICDVIVVCFVLWRVETISDLSNMESDSADMEEEESQENGSDAGFLEAAYKRIGPLLQRRCIDTQIYLQHDLTSSQLARVIGTNRYYLSQYFASQGTTYNAYINTLRINHFVEIYRDAIAHRRPFTVQQLANDSGYRSYSTFSIAFKQRMGQNVTAWTKKEEALKY